jgi:hypothetical protein
VGFRTKVIDVLGTHDFSMNGPVPSSTLVRLPLCAATNLAELTVRKLATTARNGE